MFTTIIIKKRFLPLALLIIYGLCSQVFGQTPQTSNATKQRQLQQRIDFGNAYIMGQSIKSGAVYLLHRKQSNIKSMLQIRSDYREEIKEDYALEGTELAKEVAEPSEVTPK